MNLQAMVRIATLKPEQIVCGPEMTFSDYAYGMSPIQSQTITRTNADSLLIGSLPLGTIFNEISIKIKQELR